MSLGWFKRVALWKRRRQHNHLAKALLELRSDDPLSPHLPIKVAHLWRLASPEILTQVPLDVQISLPLNRRHKRLDQLEAVLDQLIQLIDLDDFEHYIRLVADTFESIHRTPISVYLSTEKGEAIDVDGVYTRINTLLYTLADVLEAREASEYNRGAYPLYKDLFDVIDQLIKLELA